jgi:hypothetical protein
MSIIHKKGAVVMSSAGVRERFTNDSRWPIGHLSNYEGGKPKVIPVTYTTVQTGKQITVSESHPRSRDGSYREGGSFYSSRVTDFLEAGYIKAAFYPSLNQIYSGPVFGKAPTPSEMSSIGYQNQSRAFGAKNEAQLLIDGTDAISYSDPINPASDLGTSLAEAFREGVPSLPGIQLWRDKTNFLRGVGSEYLNYQFGWAPLHDEVSSVVKAARKHRDLLQQYHRGEGSDTHRIFEFPLQRTQSVLPAVESIPSDDSVPGSWQSNFHTLKPNRQVSLVRETKKWFEGCFTYGLPSQSDSWGKALGFGSDADQLFGLSLSPEILWELTPWSWAVDWFSNAGEVINNVTRFGLAGLVLRYGYIMEESIEKVTASGEGWFAPSVELNAKGTEFLPVYSGTWSRGTECVTKRRYPASPFGFSIGWEGLSPTQLAITAALGITRLL